jgi:hypothetical protein
VKAIAKCLTGYGLFNTKHQSSGQNRSLEEASFIETIMILEF